MKSFRRELREVFRNTQNLPTIPAIVMLVQKALEDDDSSAMHLGRIIANDPSLSTNILRLANSAYYPSSRTHINTIPDAIVRIGMQEIGELCSSFAVIQIFGRIGGYRNHASFWKHCIVVAHAAKEICEHSEPALEVNRDEAYVAGLLHDIGMLVLERYFTDKAHEIWDDAKKRGVRAHEAELEALKMDHGDVGGKLLSKWGIAEHIMEAVSHHHRPGDSAPEARVITLVTHLADSICNQSGFDGTSSSWVSDLPGDVMDELALDESMVEMIAERVRQEAAKSEVLISIAMSREQEPQRA